MSGNDSPVSEYVMKEPKAQEFLEKLKEYGHLSDSKLHYRGKESACHCNWMYRGKAPVCYTGK